MSEKKPKWLRALEAQSWQAELIASGLAIYGSLSLGAYIDNFAEWAVLNFNNRTINILYFLILYIYTVHAVLVISFISHLILRILWAGILGLSSVFPEGINMDSKVYPLHFKEKLKKEFPDLSIYSLELDKLCSVIFSILCALVITLVATCLWIIIYLLLSEILLKFLPISVVNAIGFVFVGLIFVFSIIGTVLTQSKFKESNLSKKFGYKVGSTFAKVLYLFGYRAYSYIAQTIRTNVTSKLFFVGMFATIMISMFTALPRFQRLVPYYMSDIFVELNSHESYVIASNYLDKLTTARLLDPVIQSEVINENYIQLYIPVYQREQELMDTICDTYEWNDNLSKDKNRQLRNNLKMNCANKYYKVLINREEVQNINYQYRRNLYNGRDGYQAFINIDNLPLGNHSIQIESMYNADSVNFKRSIPFYKAK